MEYEKISEETKSKLEIESVTEMCLIFRKSFFEHSIEFYKYDDGDFGIDSESTSTFYLNKEQLEFLTKWINYEKRTT